MSSFSCRTARASFNILKLLFEWPILRDMWDSWRSKYYYCGEVFLHSRTLILYKWKISIGKTFSMLDKLLCSLLVMVYSSERSQAVLFVAIIRSQNMCREDYLHQALIVKPKYHWSQNIYINAILFQIRVRSTLGVPFHKCLRDRESNFPKYVWMYL